MEGGSEDSQVQLQIMLQINPHIRPRRHTPKCTPQLPIMHPNLNILAIKEQIQPPGVIQMQMPDDDLLHIFDFIPRSLNLRIELVLRLVPHTTEDIRELRAPDGGVVFAGAGLPQDEALVRVGDEDAVHGHFAALVDGRLAGGAGERGVGAADHEGFVGFQPADFEEPHFGSCWADGGDVVGDGAGGELVVYGGGWGGHCWSFCTVVLMGGRSGALIERDWERRVTVRKPVQNSSSNIDLRNQQVRYIGKDVDTDSSSIAAAAISLDITCMASPHSWQLATMKCGTQATYGNSIRARQSGSSKQQHGACLVRATRRPGEGKLEAVISDGVRRPRYVREGTSCMTLLRGACACLVTVV